MSPLLTAFILFITVSSAFLFSGMEAGMLALNPLRLHRNARMGKKSAMKLLRYLENPEMFLWINLIGGTTAHFISVCILTLTFYQYAQPYFLLMILGSLVGLYVVGDLVPKMIFRRKPQFFCALGLPFFRVFYLAMYPLVKAAVWIVSMLFWKRHHASYEKRLLSNRVELRRLMKNSDPDITREERLMIEHVMDFFDMTLKDMVIPMSKVKSISSNAKLAEAIELSKESTFTRLPVYQVVAGGERQTLGILSMKKVLYIEDLDEERAITDFINPPIRFRPEVHLRDALEKMQKTGQRMAIVLDNEGRELGIVTLQDILGGIFGKLNL